MSLYRQPEASWWENSVSCRKAGECNSLVSHPRGFRGRVVEHVMWSVVLGDSVDMCTVGGSRKNREFSLPTHYWKLIDINKRVSHKQAGTGC